MRKRYRILVGGIIGIMMASVISSTYFYNFIRKVIRGLNESLKDYEY